MGYRMWNVSVTGDPETQAAAWAVWGEAQEWLRGHSTPGEYELRDPCFDQSSLAGVVVKILVIDRDGLSNYSWRSRIFERSYQFAIQLKRFLRSNFKRASEVNLEFRI